MMEISLYTRGTNDVNVCIPHHIYLTDRGARRGSGP